MINNPLVSIIIPVYNGEKYVKEAIDSALNQTYKNIEVIVINDGSTDKTDEIILSFGDKVKYIKKENGGVSSALNIGLNEMRGEYFSWLSHDDMYSPTKIEKQIELLEGNKDKKIVALSSIDFIDKNSKKMALYAKPRFKNAGIINCRLALKGMLKNGSYNGCAFLLPRSVFKECGYFKEDYRFIQDVVLWTNLFLRGYDIIFSLDKEVFSRKHAEQVTNKKRDLLLKESNDFAKEIVPTYVQISSRKFNFIFYYAKRNAVLNNVEAVKIAIKEGKKTKKVNFIDILKLRFWLTFGVFRPFIRKVYYKLVRKI